ncbi:MAG: aldose epimerase, partial [Bacilli bacterium]|nr:aldose epimerase [Bacilli bacterium]
MTAQVQEITFLGEAAIQASNDYFEAVVVPGWGSAMISLVFKEKQLELLRVPKSAEDYLIKPALYGTPILFPPNRISEGRFSFGERNYQFAVNEPAKNNHIHGFVYREKWELVRTEVTGERVVVETEFDSSKFPEVMKQFPHNFVIRMTYTLDGGAVHKDATIINKSSESFPWGIGYHTTFRFPFRPGDALDKCKFSLTTDKKWLLNERNLPTGELIEIQDLEKWRSGISLVGQQLDDVFLSSVVSGGQNQAKLVD